MKNLIVIFGIALAIFVAFAQEVSADSATLPAIDCVENCVFAEQSFEVVGDNLHPVLNKPTLTFDLSSVTFPIDKARLRLTPDNHNGIWEEASDSGVPPFVLVQTTIFEGTESEYGVTSDGSVEYWEDDGSDPNNDLADILQSHAGQQVTIIVDWIGPTCCPSDTGEGPPWNLFLLNYTGIGGVGEPVLELADANSELPSLVVPTAVSVQSASTQSTNHQLVFVLLSVLLGAGVTGRVILGRDRTA